MGSPPSHATETPSSVATYPLALCTQRLVSPVWITRHLPGKHCFCLSFPHGFLSSSCFWSKEISFLYFSSAINLIYNVWYYSFSGFVRNTLRYCYKHVFWHGVSNIDPIFFVTIIMVNILKSDIINKNVHSWTTQFKIRVYYEYRWYSLIPFFPFSFSELTPILKVFLTSMNVFSLLCYVYVFINNMVIVYVKIYIKIYMNAMVSSLPQLFHFTQCCVFTLYL